MNEKSSNRNRALFLGLVFGFLILYCMFWFLNKGRDIVIPIVVFTGIILAAIGLLLVKPLADGKKIRN